MAKNSIPKFGLGIDWETSGYTLPNYTDKHQGISFGAVVFDTTTLLPIEDLYLEVKFDSSKYQWDSGAERVHGLSREHLEKNGVSQEEAAIALGSMVLKYWGTEAVMLLGHRVYFDKAFTRQLTESQGLYLDYHPTMIDSSSMGTILLETSWSDDVFQLLGLQKRGKHNALEDIMNTLDSVRKMKEFFINGVASSL